MASSRRQRSISRRIFWLTVFVVLLFGGYTAGWLYLANWIQAEVVTAVAGMNRDGVTVACANPTVRGFPFRIGLFCDGMRYEDPRQGVSVSAGGLRTAAQVYNPAHNVAEVDGPLTVAAPGVAPLTLDWRLLRGSVRLAEPLPKRTSVETNGLTVRLDDQPAPLFEAAHAEGHLRPNGADVDYAGRFEGLRISPAAAGGRTLPELAGAADATLKDGVAVLTSGDRDLRGRAAEIRTLELQSGDAAVSIAGPVAVDTAGLVDATLTIRIRNPTRVAALLAEAFPEARSQIEQGFAGLSVLGAEPSMPLTIVKGQATLGFIPLGAIPPL